MDGTHNTHPATAPEALEQLGRLSLRGLSMEALLQTVADLTTEVMPGNSDTSVTLLVRGRPTTVVSTGRPDQGRQWIEAQPSPMRTYGILAWPSTA